MEAFLLQKFQKNHHYLDPPHGGKAFGFLFAPKEYDIKKD